MDNDSLDAFLRLCDKVKGEGEASRHSPAGAPTAFHDADGDAGDPTLRDRHTPRPYFKLLFDLPKKDALHACLEYLLTLPLFCSKDQLQLSVCRDDGILAHPEADLQGIRPSKDTVDLSCDIVKFDFLRHQRHVLRKPCGLSRDEVTDLPLRDPPRRRHLDRSSLPHAKIDAADGFSDHPHLIARRRIDECCHDALVSIEQKKTHRFNRGDRWNRRNGDGATRKEAPRNFR